MAERVSREREFLKKLRYASLLENDLRKELEELLAQPEQEPTTRHALDSYWNQEAYQRGYAEAKLKLKREPLSDGATADMWHANKKATHADSYWAGVYDAEKHHGIGGEDEN